MVVDLCIIFCVNSDIDEPVSDPSEGRSTTGSEKSTVSAAPSPTVSSASGNTSNKFHVHIRFSYTCFLQLQ